MPPSVKFTKEEIVGAALRVVREGGIESLTARSLAAELGASTRPMFTYFATMDELKHEVHETVKGIYRSYIEKGLEAPIPFLGVGQSIIRFAHEEPELFKFVFMGEGEGDEQSHYLPSGDPTSSDVLAALSSSHGMDDDSARDIYNHLSVYAYGLAVLFARRSCVFTMDYVDRMLSEVFYALKSRKETENE